YAGFLVDEGTRADARPADIEGAAEELKRLPLERSVSLLRAQLLRGDPDVRVAAALALHTIDPADAAAPAAVVAVATDRTIRRERDHRADRWCRVRALEAAVAWDALKPAELRTHLADERPEHPVF